MAEKSSQLCYGLEVGGDMPKVWETVYQLKELPKVYEELRLAYEESVSMTCHREGCFEKFADIPREISAKFWFHSTFCWCSPDKAICEKHVLFCEMCDLPICDQCKAVCKECKGTFCRTYCCKDVDSYDTEMMCSRCLEDADYGEYRQDLCRVVEIEI